MHTLILPSFSSFFALMFSLFSITAPHRRRTFSSLLFLHSRDTPPIPHRCALRATTTRFSTSNFHRSPSKSDRARKFYRRAVLHPCSSLPRVFLLCACDDDHDDDHEPALNLFTNARSRRKFHTLSSSSSNIPLCRVLNCGALMTTMTTPPKFRTDESKIKRKQANNLPRSLPFPPRLLFS